MVEGVTTGDAEMTNYLTYEENTLRSLLLSLNKKKPILLGV